MSPKKHNNYSKTCYLTHLGLKIMKLFPNNSLVKSFLVLPSSFFILFFIEILQCGGDKCFWKLLEIFVLYILKKS
jgi:hypothetical protein